MDLHGKKILFVITKSNWGGAQSYIYTLAAHFNTTGANVAVALGGTGGKDASTGLLADKLETAGVRTIFLKSFVRDISFSREFRAFTELLGVIRKERPDILHVNSSKAGGLGALAGRIARVPKIVFTSHGLAYDEDRPLLARSLIWFSTWLTVLLTHITIVISEDNYDRARKLPFCKNKIRLVYNGITASVLRDRADARTKLLPDETRSGVLWIGTIAELTRNKALAYLIEAAALLKKRGYTFVLCVIGVGEEREKLEQMIVQEDVADCVHLLGFVSGAASVLTAFDIFTLTSVKEGLPYVLLEAAQAKCAVVATRIPGNTDIVDASTGILVEPKNTHELTRALELLITDQEKRAELSTKLHEKVQEKFSIERMLKELTALYD